MKDTQFNLFVRVQVTLLVGSPINYVAAANKSFLSRYRYFTKVILIFVREGPHNVRGLQLM